MKIQENVDEDSDGIYFTQRTFDRLPDIGETNPEGHSNPGKAAGREYKNKTCCSSDNTLIRIAIPVITMVGVGLMIYGINNLNTDCLEGKVSKSKNDKKYLYVGAALASVGTFIDLLKGIAGCGKRCLSLCKRETAPAEHYRSLNA